MGGKRRREIKRKLQVDGDVAGTGARLPRLYLQLHIKLGMVVHTSDPSTQELEGEDLEFKVILSYVASSRLA